MEDAKGDLAGLVRGQAEQRAAQGDATYVGELGMQLADLRAAAVEQVREYERRLVHVVMPSCQALVWSRFPHTRHVSAGASSGGTDERSTLSTTTGSGSSGWLVGSGQ